MSSPIYDGFAMLEFVWKVEAKMLWRSKKTNNRKMPTNKRSTIYIYTAKAKQINVPFLAGICWESVSK